MKDNQIFAYALRLCGIDIDESSAILVLKVHDRVKARGADFSLKDASELVQEFQQEMEQARPEEPSMGEPEPSEPEQCPEP